MNNFSGLIFGQEFFMLIHLTLLQMSVLRLEEIYVITRHTCNKDQYNTIKKWSLLPSVLDVLVEDDGHAHGDEGVEPGGHEHDRDAEREADQGERPVVEAEAGSPVGGAQKGLQGARQVHEAVAHQEEHGQQGRQDVHVPWFTISQLQNKY